MKKITASVLLVFMLMAVSKKSSAQFVFADNVETTVSTAPVTVSNTGNDILDYGGNSYEVSVWDDAAVNAGMGWKRGVLTGYVPFSQSSVVDPDVCIAKNAANTIFATAVYYSGTGGNVYTIESFRWDVPTSSFIAAGTVTFGFPGTPFGTTVNIDSDDGGDFAVVWDDPSQQVFIVTGHIGNPPTLYFSGNAITIASGKNPDMGIFYFGPANNMAEVVYISTAGKIIVDYHRMADLASGIVNTANEYTSPAASFGYHYPRIAVSNFGAGADNDWTVVAEDNDGIGSYHIVGFNEHVSGTQIIRTSWVYNNASGTAPFNTVDVPNLRPVATYDIDNAPWIGWTMDNSSGLIPVPSVYLSEFPIASVCNKGASILSGSAFMYVANNVNNFQAYQSLSMAGRKSANCMFTFFSGPSSSVVTKTSPHAPTPTHLRINSASNIISWLQTTLQNENRENEKNNFILRIFDVAGREVIMQKGGAEEILTYLETEAAETLKGIYVANIISEDNQLSYTGKLFTGR